jgi:hypothetical protein
MQGKSNKSLGSDPGNIQAIIMTKKGLTLMFLQVSPYFYSTVLLVGCYGECDFPGVLP